MLFPRTPVAIASLSLIATTHAQSCGSIKCDDVHFFLARGNNEPYPGRQGALVAATCNGLSSCGYEDLIYSSLYTDLSCQTTYDGAIAGHIQMAKYASACPNAKLILTGYSEGANVATDILGGTGGASFNGCVEPAGVPAMDRTTKPGSQIVAAIVFGNERHTAGQSYNFGNGSAIDGLFPRPASQLASLNAYADVLRDWCLANDPICAANQADSSVSAHLGYFNVYSNAAASWIKSVASLTDDSSFATVIPTSLSGIVQDYATVGTATPSGTVTLDTTYTQFTAVTPCTSASTVSKSSSSSIASSTSMTNTRSTSGNLPVSSSPSDSSSSSASGSRSSSVSSSSSSSSGSPAKTTPAATLSSQTTSRTSSATGTSTSSASGADQVFGTSLFTMGVVIMFSMCI